MKPTKVAKAEEPVSKGRYRAKLRNSPIADRVTRAARNVTDDVRGLNMSSDKQFKADQLYAVEWALPGSAGKAYEIWIDDVTLTDCP